MSSVIGFKSNVLNDTNALQWQLKVENASGAISGRKNRRLVCHGFPLGMSTVAWEDSHITWALEPVSRTTVVQAA